MLQPDTCAGLGGSLVNATVRLGMAAAILGAYTTAFIVNRSRCGAVDLRVGQRRMSDPEINFYESTCIPYMHTFRINNVVVPRSKLSVATI